MRTKDLVPHEVFSASPNANTRQGYIATRSLQLFFCSFSMTTSYHVEEWLDSPSVFFTKTINGIVIARCSEIWVIIY